MKNLHTLYQQHFPHQKSSNFFVFPIYIQANSKIGILMLKFFAIFFSLLLSVQSAATPNQKEYVVYQGRNSGFFSVAQDVLIGLAIYERGDIQGFDVSFGRVGLYYDAKKGPNWWNYYFEPICMGNRKKAKVKLVSFFNSYWSFFFDRSREENYAIIEKYIRIRPFIQKKVDDFFKTHLEGYHVISVHYRGTDKISEAPRVPYEDVLHEIHKQIKEVPLGKNYRIFLATDEALLVDYLMDKFPGRVASTSINRSLNKQPLHLSKKNRFEHGEEALIDCLLLSKGDVLIRCCSNLSMFATFFNPRMPVIKLNDSYWMKDKSQFR